MPEPKSDRTTPFFQAEIITVFYGKQDWINRAQRALGHIRERQEVLLCLDSEGYACHIGEDFRVAKEQNRYPVTAYKVLRSAHFGTAKTPNS